MKRCKLCRKPYQEEDQWYTDTYCSLKCYSKRAAGFRGEDTKAKRAKGYWHYRKHPGYINRSLKRFRKETKTRWPYLLGKAGHLLYERILAEEQAKDLPNPPMPPVEEPGEMVCGLTGHCSVEDP